MTPTLTVAPGLSRELKESAARPRSPRAASTGRRLSFAEQAVHLLQI